MLSPQGGSLLKLLAAGILGDVVEHQPGDRRQVLAGGLAVIPLGILAAEGFHIRDQRLQLIEKQRVRKNPPAVDHDCRWGSRVRHQTVCFEGRLLMESSSSRGGPSRSTVIPPTSSCKRPASSAVTG